MKNAIKSMDESVTEKTLKQTVEQDCSDPVLDAIFMNVGTDNNKLPDWYKQKEKRIKDVSEFKHNAKDFTHFAVDRNGKYRHHFFTLRPDTDIVTIVHYSDALFNHSFGIGEVQSANYKFEGNDLIDFESVVDFANVKCYKVLHDEQSNETLMERYSRTMERMGERFYNVQHNNCEHFVNYVLDGVASAPMTEKMMGKASVVDAFLSEVKSVGLLATFVIALIGIALSSIVRQSYVRIFIATLISYERQDNLGLCTSPLGRHLIQNARNRFEFDIPIDSGTSEDNLIIQNISRYLNSPLVCGKAQYLGYTTLLKSSIYLLFVFFMLQTAFILMYNYMHLKPMRRICLQQNKLYLYRKYLYREVFGGYTPIVVTVIYGGILQYKSSLPPTAHYLALCLFGVAWRLIVSLSIECLFRKFRGRHDKYVSYSLVIILIIAYIICIILHYRLHAEYDPL